MAGQLTGMGPHLTRWCEGPHRALHLARSSGSWRGVLRYQGPFGPCGIELMSRDLADLWDRLDELARQMLAAGIVTSEDVARALSEPVSVRWSGEEVTHG